MSMNSYTFSEIVFGLRDEYIKTQKLLDELEKYIEVENGNDYELGFSANFDFKKMNVIRLDILKKQNKLEKIYKYIYYNYFKGYIAAPNNLIVVREGEHYNFVVEETPYYEFEKNPKVIINNHDEFDKLVEKIYDTDVMKFKRDFIHLNPFQTIFIRPNGVSMSGRFDYIEKGAYSNLKYNTSNDTIEIISNLKNPNGLMCDFFDTKISKELVPDIYQDIIDNSIYRYGDLNYYGSLSNNNAVYDIDVCENQVVLTKKRDLKFYER